MYRVDGKRIEQDNVPVQLFSVNVIGMEGADAAIGGLWTGLSIPEFLGAIKARGFNTLRLPIGPKTLSSVAVNSGIVATWYAANAYLAGKNSMEVLDEWIKGCEALGLRYIFAHYNIENGAIPDLWYTASYSESKWLSDLTLLANRYKNNPGFVGIDIKQAPGVGATWGTGNAATDFKIAAKKAFDAINAVNTDIILFLQWLSPGVGYGFGQYEASQLDVPQNRYVYSARVYGPDVWGPNAEGFTDPSFPSNMAAIWERQFGDTSDAGRAVFIGEFGGQYGTGSASEKPWMDAFIAYLNSKQIKDFAYWGWGENAGANSGAILSDSSWRTWRADKLAALELLATADRTFVENSGPSVPASDPSVKGYRVIDGRIYHNGHRIQCFGVNVIGGELVEASISGLYTGLTIPEFLGHIKSLKFNCIRFPIGPKLIDNVPVDGGFIATWHAPNAYLAGKGSLEIFDEWIKECEILGLRYIIDIHQLENGNIPDLWYTASYPESRWLSDIQLMATRYKGNPGFIGIDIKNEPNSNTATWGTGNVATDWKIASEKAWGIISAANDDILIIVEPLGLTPGLEQLTNNPPAIPENRLLYSPHIYGPDVWWPFGEGFQAPNFPANMPPIWDDIFGTAAKGKGIYIGEFGGQYGTGHPLDDDWQDAFVGYLKDRGFVDFTYWGWGETSGGDTGGILADSGWRNVRTDKMNNLLRLWTPEASYSQATPYTGVIAAGPTPPSKYRVYGNRIHHNGHPIQLFGVSVIGMETNDAVVGGLWGGMTIAEYIGHIKNAGFNSIRFPVGPKTLSGVTVAQNYTASAWYPPNFYLADLNSLQILDEWINECEKVGMRYIFDHHYLENGIPDLWYTALFPESAWLSDLVKLATRYKGKQGFVGIDLKNEPSANTATWGDGVLATDWKAAAERAYAAINAVNQDIIIFVEWLSTSGGLKQMTDNPLTIPLERLSLSPHIYGPDVWWPFGAGFSDPLFPKNMPNEWERMFGSTAQTQNVWVGEFGGQYGLDHPLDDDWHDELVNYMKRRGIIDFAYWGWGPNSGSDVGGIVGEDYKTVRADKMAMLNVLKTSEASYTPSTLTTITPNLPPAPTEELARLPVDYKNLLLKLFPRGRAWVIEEDSVTYKAVDAFSQELSRVDTDVAKLMREMDPRSARELFEDWEKEYGLPDDATPINPTLAERRFQLITKIVATGGQSKAYFQSLVGAEGDTLTITEDAPNTVPANIPMSVKGIGFKFVWKVSIPDIINQYFEANDLAETPVSEIIDPEFVARLIMKYKPAHTHVEFV